jgi:hypothetical protein
MNYLITISCLLCVAYILFLQVFNYFFAHKTVPIPYKAVSSITLIFFLSLIGYAIAFKIHDIELANRIMHGFGGGFLAFLVCYLAVRDSELKISRFQFFVFSFLLVTAMGVANEILECILQQYGGLRSATSVTDTWYDLISNTVGILIAAAFLVPFISKLKSSKPWIR